MFESRDQGLCSGQVGRRGGASARPNHLAASEGERRAVEGAVGSLRPSGRVRPSSMQRHANAIRADADPLQTQPFRPDRQGHHGERPFERLRQRAEAVHQFIGEIFNLGERVQTGQAQVDVETGLPHRQHESGDIAPISDGDVRMPALLDLLTPGGAELLLRDVAGEPRADPTGEIGPLCSGPRTDRPRRADRDPAH